MSTATRRWRARNRDKGGGLQPEELPEAEAAGSRYVGGQTAAEMQSLRGIVQTIYAAEADTTILQSCLRGEVDRDAEAHAEGRRAWLCVH